MATDTRISIARETGDGFTSCTHKPVYIENDPY